MRFVYICLISCFMVLIGKFVGFAYDFSPISTNSISNWGIGVYFAPHDVLIYSVPDEKSEILDRFIWDELGLKSASNQISSKTAFLSFSPKRQIALFVVVDDVDGWYQIIYDHNKGLKGWVKSSGNGKFMTWYRFMNKYGRDKGAYFLKEIPAGYKNVYTGPDETSQILNDSYYYPDELKVKFIRGNWMLVKIIDFNKSASIGWIRWRDKDGKIFVFPNVVSE